VSLIGHDRTRARRAVEALRPYDPGIVAQLLSMRRHTVAAILSGRMLPGPRFAAAASRLASH
jgi:hypothetical protein